jgi:hypothetical protein
MREAAMTTMALRQAAEKFGGRALIAGLAVLAALGFTLRSPADQISHLDARVSALELASVKQHALVSGLARKTCMEDYDGARLAGLPCNTLLDGAR